METDPVQPNRVRSYGATSGNNPTNPDELRDTYQRGQSQHMIKWNRGSLAHSMAQPKSMIVNVMSEGYREGLQGYKSPLNLLLVFVPLGIMSGWLKWSATMVFMLNFIGCVPLATILGQATEDVAEHTNETIGGLINATFGNTVEIILSLAALKSGQFDVVVNTLIGSILSNLLLVMGSSLLFGGLYYREQEINPIVVEGNTLALGVATIGFALPTIFSFALNQLNVQNKQSASEIFSLVTAILVLTVYGLYLFFQLYTHADYFESDELDGQNDIEIEDIEDAHANMLPINGGHLAGEEDDHVPPASMPVAVTILLIDVLIVSWSSEYLVDSIEGFSEAMHLGKAFVAVILLPIISNSVEHISSIMVAVKDKMDLSIGIACGSSVQIAMFAAPLMVIFSWIFSISGGPKLTLEMNLLSLSSLMSAVFISGLTLRDATTNWLEGAVLILIYLMVATAFFLIG